MSNWIHSLAPAHKHRVYLYAGGLGEMWGWPHAGVSEVVNDVHHLLCLVPDTRVLTPDMRWRAIGDLKPGDPVLGFDESNGPTHKPGLGAPSRYRRFQPGQVLKTRRVTKPCYRLTFDDGTVVTCSADHQWLSGSRARPGGGGTPWSWLTTEKMVCGKKQRSHVLKLANVAQKEDSWDAGWMAGFADGEGTLHVSPGTEVTLSQAVGPEADRAENILLGRGFRVSRRDCPKREEHHKEKVSLHVNGGLKEVMRFLMVFQPGRLLRKLETNLDKLSIYGRDKTAVALVKKEFLGDHEVVAVETTSNTYIAEGLASHNCNFYKVLQREDLFDGLRRRLSATPFSREEYVGAEILCKEYLKADLVLGADVNAAACFFVWNRQSMAGNMSSFSPLTRTRTRGGRNAEVNAWWGAVEGLLEVKARLDNVVIECDDALRVIDREDTKDTLYYVDPPYLRPSEEGSRKEKKKLYHHDDGVAHHEALLRKLTDKKLKAKVMVSGYASDLYDKYLTGAPGWKKHTKTIDNKMQKVDSGVEKKKMVEVLWVKG